MKTPLFVILLLAPLSLAAFSCDKIGTTCATNSDKSASAPATAKPAPPNAATARQTTPPSAPARHAGSPRRPAHLFM
jgi:hypothetical protein